ncbi:CusA/CzcA family heavy metal efflux RND transporter [Pseudogemmatithrix spongiicola]|uniref:CusA/CzcA family heavy metal efflux RND transporter n=1 Tax=Pseudogemmatithrix spongiicola TaxID=3062599 RepID=A0AA49K282_9BACT|nr:CusA/CzcA family heavy metal efflux RND transporter [Gemmatimonadaceae bacterium 'strain 138']WKW16013.1 CusA/CzcA family heavy metal efflux RND transporter [Gemmatimonadaceae bacterium 'strain 318']
MIKRLVDFALHQRFFVIGGVLTIVAFGFYALTHIPFDAYPDLTGTRVEVITSAPGMPPEDVERLVTYPLESTLMGIQGAENVRSVSKQGLSLITVSFPDKVDVYFARTLVQQRVADAVGALPPGIEPGLGPVSTPMGELFQYTVTSDSMSLAELKTLHDYTIRPRLRTVPGVSEVNSWGGFIEQVHVVADPARLASRDLTLQDLHDALDANNRTFGGAYVETAGERFTIRGVGRAESLDEIGRMVVATRGGAPVLVRDVARVEMGALPRQGAVTKDGEGEVVTGMVMKLKGADSRRVIRDVRARLDEIRGGLPTHVAVTPFYDQTQLIARTTKTITKNLIEGGLLVIAVLFLFLRNWRASLIVASVIPLSMLFAFGGMHLFGYGANLMSLGAMDFGLIVDASVVMIENFVRKLEEGTSEDRRSIFLGAAVEVGRPILFGIAIIVAVYIPIFTLDGMEGRMFKPMAFTVVTAVLGSLLLALTYVPSVASMVLKHDHEERHRLLDELRARYARGLTRAMAHGKRIVAVSAVAVLAAVVSIAFIGTEFMPKLDEGNILITSRRLPSISLGEGTRLSMEAERIIKQFPEVVTVVTKEGRPDLATEAMGLYEGDTYVILKPHDEWTSAKTNEGLIALLDSALAAIPGLEIAFTQPLAMRLDEAESGIRTDLGIKIVGPDRMVNEALGARIERIVASVEGAADVSVEIADGSGQYRVQVDRAALARYGVQVADVQAALDLGTGVAVATELVDGPRRIGVAVRLPDDARRDLESLKRITVRTGTGARVSLGSLARIETVMGPELIAHEDAQRRTLVMSNVRGRDLGSFVQEVRGRVAAEVELPSGVFLEWGGQYENQTRALGRLALVVPAVILIIYLLLFLSFGSVAQAGLVLMNVPFALVGGVAMLWLRGINLSLSASIGFIALFGIAVLNGVVMVEHINHLREKGRSLDDAVLHGAVDRLRPVLMTALVASLGFVPMAVTTSAGAEVQRPLASVVIGGLVTSTFLTLFVLPILYRAVAMWQATHPDD